MRHAAYSLDGVAWVPLPVAPRFGGAYDQEQQDLELATERGVRWIRRQFSRDKWVLTFRVTRSQLQAFQDLHDAVDGQATPFYFALDYTASPRNEIYVRKEAGFKPGQLQEPADPALYDYVMTLIGEIDPVTVLS